jgi:DNA gyrase subunit A
LSWYPARALKKIVRDVKKEIETAFLDYSMSVIVARALPDVRDGLKPVHRRILYTMHERRQRPPTKPTANPPTTVGDVLGSYHPHGDASVYDALVRLAQDFSLRYPLVDGQGNFGSVDGDPRPPTVTRSPHEQDGRRDADGHRKGHGRLHPNFDETKKEPSVLPCRFPNLLVNGSQGIAVGMATNIPPHNLGEVIDGVRALIDNPDATSTGLMEHIKGPDFPTGRHHHGPQRHPRGLRHGPRQDHAARPRRDRGGKERPLPDRRHGNPVYGQQGAPDREHRRPREGQAHRGHQPT